jgi:hypothetical protein
MSLVVPEVLVGLAMGRAEMEAKKKTPPYVAYLTPKRMMKLLAELKELNVSFGIPFNGGVPEPKEDDREWIYFGTVLDDVHVYARAR